MTPPIKKSYNLKPLLISVSLTHQKMIERLIKVKGITSKAEVFRQALNCFYDEKFKDYVYNAKKTKHEKEELNTAEAEAISEKQFVIDLGGLVYQTTSDPIAVLAGLANTCSVFPLAGIKKKLEEETYRINDHNDQVSKWSAWGTSLKAEFERDSTLVSASGAIIPQNPAPSAPQVPDMVQLTHDGN